ncbi:MAG: RNA polymerase sigma factor [Limisphaerales bacterium]
MDEHAHKQTFDEWLGRHRGLIFKVVRAYAFTPHDQDDLFQEIITQMWSSIPQFRGDSAVTTWLYRVALNTALAWRRKVRRNRDRTESLDGSELVLEAPARAPNPRLEWLYEQIARLDHVDRSLALLMLDGFSYREMAETLGITESNVGVKINRIKAHFIKQSLENTTHEL